MMELDRLITPKNVDGLVESYIASAEALGDSITGLKGLRLLAWISTEKDLLNISPSGGADYEMKRSGRLFHHGTLTGLSST
jgi:hypothetical protein